jgi:hypothetical protein
MWIKKGLVYKPNGDLWHSQSHAQVPFAYPLADRLRIYFSTRDKFGQSRPTFIETELENPQNITYIHPEPV